jgi:hypothetical protein
MISSRHSRSEATSGPVSPPIEWATTTASSTSAVFERTVSAYCRTPAFGSSHGRSIAIAGAPRRPSASTSGVQLAALCAKP